MHDEISNCIEQLLSDSEPAYSTQRHLSECPECRMEVERMREQVALLRALRAPESFEAEPRAGFYARVMERIETEGPISIWNVFIESAFGRRIAAASLALALLLGVYLVLQKRQGKIQSPPPWRRRLQVPINCSSNSSWPRKTPRHA